MARNVTRLQPGARTTLQPTNGAPRKPSPLMSHTAGVWAQSWPMLQYNPSELLTKKGPEIFDTMLLADQIRAAVAFKIESVLATGWVVESPEDQPEDWPVTEFVRRRLNGITNSFDRCLRNILTATVYGYSITEQVYKAIELGEDAGLVGIDQLITHSPHYLRFKLDENGRILAVKNDQDGEEYRRDKFMVWSYNSPFRNPYGQSDLEACYRAYILEHNTYRWLGTYLERMGIPPWIAFYNPESLDPGQQEDLKSIVKNMQNATSATLPRGAKDDLEIWVPQTSGNVQAVFMPAIQLLKQDMARALLMPGHLGVSPDQTSGSLAKARVALDMFLLSLSAVQAALGEVIQHELVNRLVDFNFDTKGVYPRFHFLEISTDDAQAICKTWGELVDLDVVNPELEDEQHIRSMLKFPRRETEEGDLPESGIDPASSRIPFRYLKDVAGALTKNEVRAAMGYPPLPQGGDELLSKPVAPPPSPQGTEAQGEAEDAEPEAEDEAPEPKTAEEALAGTASVPFADDDPTPPDSDAAELTASEKRCDFQAIVSGLDGIENPLVTKVSVLLRDMVRTQLAAWQKRPPTLARAPKVKLAFPAAVAASMSRATKQTYNQGRADTKRELAKAPAQFAEMPPTYEPTEALAYLQSLADMSVSGMNTAMNGIVRVELMNGLRNGSPFVETSNRLLEALAPWIGAPNVDPSALRPDRVLTTVRTLATSAYNTGRIVEARRSAAVGLVTGVQHSSVLDSATTPICRSLHGTMYKIDDPALDKYTPPLHFRCRSVMLPVTLDIEVSDDPNDKEHWQTPEERAAAERLVPGGFGGSFTAKPSNAPK